MKKGAVIVETRNIDWERVLDNHMRYLGEDWGIYIFCSNHNYNKAFEAAKKYKEARIVEFPLLLLDDITADAYNALITSKMFWSCIPCDKVLIFQHDSSLLRCCVDDFLEWDYIGAPWAHINMEGGNGGLSIRTKQKMIEVINHTTYNPSAHGNEDIYFCKYLPNVGGRIAPRDIAKTFSVETVYYPTPIGIHAAEKYISKVQYANIINKAS